MKTSGAPVLVPRLASGSGRDRRAPGSGARRERGRPLFVGVDGGGSKTVALVADAGGRVLGRGESGTSNHHVVGWRAAFAAVANAVEQAWQSAGGGASGAEVMALGMAGADTPEDHDKVLAWLRRQRRARQVYVVNDGALLLAATGRRAGVAVVSGTGSIAWGQDAEGRRARAGGWGHLIGDEGSGYHLSTEALRLTVKAADGRLPWGPLPRAVMRALQVDDAHGLLQFVYGPGTLKTDLARLAPVVFRLARRGDPQSRALVSLAGTCLAELVGAVAGHLRLHRPVVAFGGSLLARQPSLRSAVLAGLSFHPEAVTVVREPARGALLLARGVVPVP